MKPKILNPDDKKNWENISRFPGTEGNPFDVFLRLINKINEIPAVIFFIMIIFMGGLFTFFDLKSWMLLAFFYLLDALLISLLPKIKISFGEANSQIFLLFICRTIFIYLPFPMNVLVQSIGTLLVVYGFLIEPSIIKTTTHHYVRNNGKNIFSFIHLSDIHLENWSFREDKILSLLKEKKPDLVLFTGDFLNLSFTRNKNSIDEIIRFFNEICKICPVYYVTGSPAVDIEETIFTIQKSINGIRLDNEVVKITKNELTINLIGITCTHNPHEDAKELNSLSIDHELNILLYHSPDLIYEINPEKKISIMLSGHTHGGQIQFPFIGPLFTGSLYGRQLQSGLYRIHDTLLYISRGIGLEGLGAPRVRFLCPPEIIEWKINF